MPASSDVFTILLYVYVIGFNSFGEILKPTVVSTAPPTKNIDLASLTLAEPTMRQVQYYRLCISLSALAMATSLFSNL